MAPQVAEVVDGYEILEQIGRGGFGTTYRARSQDTGKLVVLKFPDVSLLGDPSVYERFQRELQVGQRLDHPNIARAVSVGTGPSGPYMVIQYAEGRSLRDHMEKDGPLAVEEALSVAGQVASALHYAHAHGVYHRDLKPENIILSPDGSVHIIDFGTALLEGARRITWRFLSNAVGTPDYMAPEQIQGKRGDARTDIYALGIMLYDMLTGAPPFTGDNPLAVMNQHLTVAPTPPRELNKAIPPPVDGIILKAIRKNPDERYQLAGDLERDLANYQDLNLTEFAFGPERSLLGPNRMLVLGAAAGGGFILATALLAVLALLLRG